MANQFERHDYPTPKQAEAAFREHGSRRAAAKALGISRSTFVRRLRESGVDQDQQKMDRHRLQQQVSSLKSELKKARQERLTDEDVRRYILGIKDMPVNPPAWVTDTVDRHSRGVIGTPTLFLSDWHWGEQVRPEQVFYKNQFDLSIAKNRVYRLTNRTIDVLLSHMVNPTYPGIVCPLGGDMLSGDIHEELSETNETPIMPAFIDLQETLIWMIETLADNFGRVFLPCVTGNHSRNSKKPRHKDRNQTNFDWLLYMQLSKWFENDERVQFLVASGTDLQYRIYNHRYRLTHGDQFRGGWGFVGPFAPISRSETKKRTAATTYGAYYDTLLLGHFHRLMDGMGDIIANGALKGYDEFAIDLDFPFQNPLQALWITHPKRGITFKMPIQCDDPEETPENTGWVSWCAET
jgi:hypothetical protein